MTPILGLILCLVVAILIAAAILGVLQAVLGLPALAGFAPYARVIYAIVVLLLVIAVVGWCFTGALPRFH